MFTTFSLTSLFLGVLITVPLILGSLLLMSSFIHPDYPTKAQKVAGLLYVADAVYLIVRTYMLVNNDIGSEFERDIYYIVDSTVITVFGLVPYTIIFEKYPKWWHCLITVSPLVLIPIVYFTQFHHIAMWSHMLPFLIGTLTLIYFGQYAQKIDKQLTFYFANPELHSKSWTITISIGYLMLTGLSMIRYILPGHVGFNLVISLSWSVIMLILFIFLIRQQPANVPEENTQANTPKAASTPKVAGETKMLAYESIRKALLEKCIGEKLYLNRDINLYSLARICGTNRTYLTDYLHEQQHQTFYEYINTLRMAHVDELLEKGHLSQEAIALQCGFNSAQTLRNAYFKIRGIELKRPKKGE